MRVELLKLPYKMDALEPHISEQTINFIMKNIIKLMLQIQIILLKVPH